MAGELEEQIVGKEVEPADEKAIKFYDDVIPVVRLDDGRLFVPINPISEALGLSNDGQRQRVLRDEVMSRDAMRVNILVGDQRRALLAIPLEQLPGFLFGIESRRVKVELRDKVNRYRRECFRVLWSAFAGEQVANSTVVQLPDDELTPAERNLQQAATVYQLAAAQVELERRTEGNEAGLAELEAKQQAMAAYVRGFIQETRRRLGAVERGLATSDPVSSAQAAQVSQAVKLVADLVEQRTGKKSFGMVYDTLYRQFEITTYKLLPSSDFEAAMQWLRDWYKQETERQGGLEK